MNNDTEKLLDKLVDDMMKEVSLESPSKDFEFHIMSSIKNLSSQEIIIYKPLISKKAWVLLAVGFIAFMVYLIFGVTWKDSESIITINYDVLFNNSLTQSLGNLKFSNIFAYAILSLAFMVLVQVTLLKNYFDKRMPL